MGFSSGKGESHSITYSRTPLAKHRTEIQDTGRLKRDVSDQFHAIKQMLRTLGKGEAIVSADSAPPFCLKVHTVNPPFTSISEERRLTMVDNYKAFLGKMHQYCFDPSEQDAEEVRIRKFLGQNENKPGDNVFGM